MIKVVWRNPDHLHLIRKEGHCMAKRTNGEGTIYHRKDGRWQVSFPTGLNKKNGKPEVVYKYAKTQAEAAKILHNLHVEKQMKVSDMKGEIKTGEWIRKWIDYKAAKLKTSTIASYKTNFRVHIEPYIGNIPLKELQTYHIQETLDKITTSESLFVKVYNVIHGALLYAVKQKKIMYSPCTGIIFPKKDKKKIRVFTQEEQIAFIQALKGEYYRDLFLTYLLTGMRLGEGVPLRWVDINLEERYINVNKKAIVHHNFDGEKGKRANQIVEDSCKTESSTRTITITPGLVKILERHKREQQYLAKKKGTEWTEFNLVFPNSRGNIPILANLEALFKRLVRKAGIEMATPHALRHTYATSCYENGVDIKTLSKQLGHKSVETTLDIYIHVFKQKAIKEINKLDTLDTLVEDIIGTELEEVS